MITINYLWDLINDTKWLTVADIYYLLDEARVQLADAHEKERVATEHALELNSRLTAVESQLVTYRQEKSRLEATLEVERAKLDTAEDTRSRLACLTLLVHVADPAG